MPNEITPETLREWAAEADEGEEIVLGAKELRALAEQLEAHTLEYRGQPGTITLTNDAFDNLVKDCKSPAPHNEKLQKAFDRRRKL